MSTLIRTLEHVIDERGLAIVLASISGICRSRADAIDDGAISTAWDRAAIAIDKATLSAETVSP